MRCLSFRLQDKRRWPVWRQRRSPAEWRGFYGTVIFASTYLDRQAGGWDGFTEYRGGPGPYAEPGYVPPMSWK